MSTRAARRASACLTSSRRSASGERSWQTVVEMREPTPNHGADNMSAQPTSQSRPTRTNLGVAAALRNLEGRHVSLALADGSRLDDVTLLSTGSGRTATLWVYMSGIDVFVPRHSVIDAWESACPQAA
jgi:hypothetical protein